MFSSSVKRTTTPILKFFVSHVFKVFLFCWFHSPPSCCQTLCHRFRGALLSVGSVDTAIVLSAVQSAV